MLRSYSQLDVCCASSNLTAISTACNGQTTLYGHVPTSGQDGSVTTAKWYTYPSVKCSEFQTILSGGAGETTVGAMAVAAAVAAAFSLF